jgi:hypothetical protein
MKSLQFVKVLGRTFCQLQESNSREPELGPPHPPTGSCSKSPGNAGVFFYGSVLGRARSAPVARVAASRRGVALDLHPVASGELAVAERGDTIPPPSRSPSLGPFKPPTHANRAKPHAFCKSSHKRPNVVGAGRGLNEAAKYFCGPCRKRSASDVFMVGPVIGASPALLS